MLSDNGTGRKPPDAFVAAMVENGFRPSDIQAWLDHVTDVLSYIDTVELFLRYTPHGLRREVQAVHAHRVQIKECIDRNGVLQGYRLIVNQPTTEMLRLLADLQARYHATLFRVDIAVDWLTRTQAGAGQLMQLLLRWIMLRWRRKGAMYDHGEAACTHYWVFQAKRTQSGKRRSARDLAVYADKPSKFGGEPCVHLELRYQNTEACRRQDVQTAIDLINLNPRFLFDKHVRLSDGARLFVNNIIREHVYSDRLNHLATRSKAKSEIALRFEERSRAAISRRVASIYERGGKFRAQWVKHHHPRWVEKSVPISVLSVPNCLTWPQPNP